jgi:tryptophan 2,3-dioxygenase
LTRRTTQNYELWFKQILHDLDSIRDIFALPKLPERATGTRRRRRERAKALTPRIAGIIARRLERVVKIQTLLVGQMSILETMTPLDFLDFRDYLFPASGFQSVQFRLLENSLGLLRERRMKYSRADYDAPLSEAHRALVAESERRPSLFALVEKWLERTPFVESKDFDFWAAYKEVRARGCVRYEASAARAHSPSQSAHQFFASERQLISNNAELAAEERTQRLRDWETNEKNFLSIFDEEDFKQQIAKGTRRLSYGATKAAIMINLYGDEPAFQVECSLSRALSINWKLRSAH